MVSTFGILYDTVVTLLVTRLTPEITFLVRVHLVYRLGAFLSKLGSMKLIKKKTWAFQALRFLRALSEEPYVSNFDIKYCTNNVMVHAVQSNHHIADLCLMASQRDGSRACWLWKDDGMENADGVS